MTPIQLLGFQLSIIVFYFSEISVLSFFSDLKLSFWKKMLITAVALFFNQVPILAPLLIDPLLFWVILIIHGYRVFSYRTLYLALAPSVFVDLVSRFLASCLIPYLFQIHVQVTNHLWINLLAYLLLFPSLQLFSYLIGKDYKKIYENEYSEDAKRFVAIMLIFIFAYYIDIFFILGFEDPFLFYLYPNSVPRSYQIFYLTFSIIFLFLLAYFNRLSKLHLERALRREKENYIENLVHYGNHLEKLYKEITVFKDTYFNKLAILGKAIEAKDISLIRNVYESTVTEAREYWDDKHYNISKLSNIGMPSIKSLLSAKIIKAEKLGITVNLEVPDHINNTYISRFDLLLLISIFCDNAIEAAIESTAKTITIAYFKSEGKQILVVANSCLEKRVNINRIFKEGVSTKGKGRGIGLANVLNIVQKYSNLSLSTQSKDYTFQQLITITKECGV
ncbi:GHKL domain-containing protein [Streptococcus porcinus]